MLCTHRAQESCQHTSEHTPYRWRSPLIIYFQCGPKSDISGIYHGDDSSDKPYWCHGHGHDFSYYLLAWVLVSLTFGLTVTCTSSSLLQITLGYN
jgi:hypothetical protein